MSSSFRKLLLVLDGIRSYYYDMYKKVCLSFPIYVKQIYGWLRILEAHERRHKLIQDVAGKQIKKIGSRQTRPLECQQKLLRLAYMQQLYGHAFQ